MCQIWGESFWKPGLSTYIGLLMNLKAIRIPSDRDEIFQIWDEYNFKRFPDKYIFRFSDEYIFRFPDKYIFRFPDEIFQIPDEYIFERFPVVKSRIVKFKVDALAKTCSQQTKEILWNGKKVKRKKILQKPRTQHKYMEIAVLIVCRLLGDYPRHLW